ncbi:MAG: type IX secretion system membrane protein PorP/SprF [Cytophagaceae bacterium]|jgi:type IX secretion system PorP/SprF family membrane protein|nr:type IX secretion system membrane protein PorP/SprF [Cytophagaceae bacterium]
MKKNLILLFAVLLAPSLFAQQLPVISQFQYNRLLYNPGYAGSNEQLSASTLFRKQWIGNLPKTPATGLFALDAPIGTTRLAAGGYAIHDVTGVTSNTELSGALSYRLKVGAESYLSMGMNVAASFYKSNVTQLKVWDANDEVFINNDIQAVIPKLGVGAYYYHTNYYAGLSSPDLFIIDQQKLFSPTINGEKVLYRNLIAMGGANINLTNRFILSPSVLIKYFPNAPLYLAVNTSLKLSEKLQAGVGYRTPTSFAMFGSMNISEKIKLGYAFDFNPSNFSLGTAGSHEFMVSYGFQQ